MTASTLLHLLVLSIELGTVQTGAIKVDPARKLKCTTAAYVMGSLEFKSMILHFCNDSRFPFHHLYFE